MRLLTPIPRHSELLQISQDSRKIENILADKLVSLVNSIQKLEKQDQIFIASDYTEKINTSIRRAVDQIYQIAGNYAANFTRKEYYNTRSDIDSIQRLAESYIELFNSRLQRFVISNTGQEVGSTASGKKIKVENIVQMTIADLTQKTMREAIINKSQQILNPTIITTAALEDEDSQETKVVYVWVTSQDDKVCPICSGYEGQTWDFEDYDSIPEIPEDSHPNCRCVIQLAEAV